MVIMNSFPSVSRLMAIWSGSSGVSFGAQVGSPPHSKREHSPIFLVGVCLNPFDSPDHSTPFLEI